MTVQVWRARRWLTLAVAAVAVLAPIASLAPARAATKTTAQQVSPDRTSTTEARRVDSVPTPKLAWGDCYVGAQCATVLLPMDYDEPNGAKTKVSLLRHQARDQAHRIGSLFLNPGGPGGSGTYMANLAPTFMTPALLDRFDIVGVDPRGVNLSEQVNCFTSVGQQVEAVNSLNLGFPMGKAEERAFTATSSSLGAGCSSAGRPLSGSMSTAEVARDMDVLRRAVGDQKLTFLGFSYGSYLGQVYANMFPDRVRAVTIDGVVDPIAWAGTPATASRPTFDRLRSADASSRALRQILTLCDRAGEQKCQFAAAGDPVANYDLLANRLKKKPVLLPPPYDVELTYPLLVAGTLGLMYSPEGYKEIDAVLSLAMTLTEPPAATSPASTANAVKVIGAFVTRLKGQDAGQKRAGFGLSYANSDWESRTSVVCTDQSSSPDAASWPKAADAADKRAKYFGRSWVWITAGCASDAWTVRDEDAYRGPFNRRTASPVLVVGNTWDPATGYEGALKVASLLPNSRLLSSDNWGHTAYGTSQCATSAIETYLLTQEVPAPGTNCHGDVQPFQDNPVSGLLEMTPHAHRAPVVPPVALRN